MAPATLPPGRTAFMLALSSATNQLAPHQRRHGLRCTCGGDGFDRCRATTINFAGDGAMMTSQGSQLPCGYGGAPICIVFNNGMYGTIRMHQERRHPSRVYGTQLVNPDFAKYGESFGGKGFTVTDQRRELTPPLPRRSPFTRSAKKPAVIELKVDPQDLTPGASLDTISDNARKAKGL